MSAAAGVLEGGRHAVQHEAVPASSALDQLIFAADPFRLSLEEQRAFCELHVRSAVAWHVERCPAYAALVRRSGVDWRHAPLDQIPVIPTAAFKRQPVLAVAPAAIAKWCESSGTRGTQSRVGRDRVSLERLIGSVRAGIGLIGDWNEDEVEVIHLGPDRQQAGSVWFLYVMSLIELLHPTRHYVSGGRFDAAGALARIVDLLDRGDRHVAVVGAPFRVLELLDVLAAGHTPCEGKDQLTVVTAGGWKRLSGQQIARQDFDARVCQAFSLADPAQVRDAFNQVELNTVFVECAAHRKHVPPWVHASTRDPDRLAVQEPGSLGLLSYLDASATSYPCFLVTDDVGRVRHGPCECGRCGTTVEFVRRLERSSDRGCALAIARDAATAGSGAAP